MILITLHIEEAKAEVMKSFCYAEPLSGPVGRGSANRATFANDESRPGSQNPQDWHVISPFYYTALPPFAPASPFTLPLTHPLVPPDQLSELPWREQWPHVQAMAVHSLTPPLSSSTPGPPEYLMIGSHINIFT